MRELRARGPAGLALATSLLQRARLADPYAGLWEASDLQWRTRRPRASDEVDQLFWLDAEGPVAAVYLTSWPSDAWECDLLRVPGGGGPELDEVWKRAGRLLDDHAAGAAVEVPVPGGDQALADIVEGAGLTADDTTATAWLDAADAPPVAALPDGVVLVDRRQRHDAPHPMRHRNGDDVAVRLSRCSLYDPELDLAIETADGVVAGYALLWNDPVTSVAEVEPVRVEDDFRRRGLARALVSAGIGRVVDRGAARVVIGYGSEDAGTLYRSLGFRPTSVATIYGTPSWPPAGRG